MNARTLAALLLTTTVHGAFADEPVAASFDRMLGHPPYHGPTVVTAARGMQDPLAARVHATLRDGAAIGADNSGFARMLSHSPYFGPTVVSVDVNERSVAEEFIHTALWAPAQGGKHVHAAFERMLSHEPYRGPTAVTVGGAGAGDVAHSIRNALAVQERLAVRLSRRND